MDGIADSEARRDRERDASGCGRAELIERLRGIAFGRSNDAVRLVFLEPEQARRINGYDLTLLSEIKRGANGLVEVKLVNRLEAVELLARMLDSAPDSDGDPAESFFKAMDRAAALAACPAEDDARGGESGAEDVQ